MSDKSTNNEQKSCGNSVLKLKSCQSHYGGGPVNSPWNLFTAYSERSTIHGFRYLGEKQLHWSERMWWLISIAISVCFCGYFIYRVWLKLTPVIITFADTTIPISELPFPTVTICPDIKVVPSVLDYGHNLGDMDAERNSDINPGYNNFTYEMVQQMYSLVQFCDDHFDSVFKYIQHKDMTIDRNIMPHLEKITPNLFYRAECYFASHQSFSCEAFNKILTDDGLCYTFNHLNSTEIYRTKLLADDFPLVKSFQSEYIEEGLDANGTEILRNHEITFPYYMRTAGQGLRIELSMSLKDRNESYFCTDYFNGNRLKLIIHSAEDVPRMGKFFYSIPLNHNIYLTVRPNKISTDRDVIENYTKFQRKCVAEKENELRFFRKYSQSNCQLEIFLKKTLEDCNCTLFWMPRLNETKICFSPQEMLCFRYIKRSLIDVSSCLPSCDSVSYDAEMTMIKLYDPHPGTNVRPVKNVKVIITISLKDEQYFSTLRSESYGKIDFICGCAGILSLFMGVSFLSIVEIVYFSTFRVFCNRRRGREADHRLMGLDQLKDEGACNQDDVQLDNLKSEEISN